MSNANYATEPNIRLKPPEFTPGINLLGHASATNLLMLGASTATMGLVAALHLPFSETSIDTVSEKADRYRIAYLIFDKMPYFVPDKDPHAAATIPFKELASLVSTALGLGKTDVARILGVSRPTLYAWIKGASEPRENDHPERLRVLGELTLEICRESSRPIYHRFVEEPLPGQTVSILSLLQVENWDLSRLRTLLAEARRLTMERDRFLGNDAPITVSDARQEANLLDNSIALDLG